MFNISTYLEKFKNFGQGEKLLKETVASIIKEAVGIEVETKNICFKNGEVLLKVSPAVKSLVYIKKESILKKIKDKITTPTWNIH